MESGMKYFALILLILTTGLNGCVSLREAIINGDMEQIKKCIQRGANINEYDERGYTPLLNAIMEGCRPDVIDYLLSHGAYVNLPRWNDIESPLVVAINRGCIYGARKLLQSGAYVTIAAFQGRSALSYALSNMTYNYNQYNDEKYFKAMLPIARELIEKNPPMNELGKSMSFWIADGMKSLLREIGKKPKDHPLRKDVTELATQLIHKGIDANDIRDKDIDVLQSWIGIAHEYKYDELVSLLLQKGADRNYKAIISKAKAEISRYKAVSITHSECNEFFSCLDECRKRYYSPASCPGFIKTIAELRKDYYYYANQNNPHVAERCREHYERWANQACPQWNRCNPLR